MSSIRLGKGGTQATWDLIYKSRQQILNNFAKEPDSTAGTWVPRSIEHENGFNEKKWVKIKNGIEVYNDYDGLNEAIRYDRWVSLRESIFKKINNTQTLNSDKILEWLIKYHHLPLSSVNNLNSVAPFRDLEVHDNGNDLSLSVRLPKGGDIKEVLAILGGRLRSYVDKFPAGEVSDEELQHLVDCAHAEALAANREQKGKDVPDLTRAIGLWLWDRSKTHPHEGNEALKKSLLTEHPLPDEVDEGHFYRLIKHAEKCIAAGKALPLTQ
ncbi:MAG: hypothetical protein EOM37_16815 [Proteobacteria bacterium]|nr:hypothetical protein [Pseudomonadota bacterium]